LIRQCFALDPVLSKRNVQSKTFPNRYLLFCLIIIEVGFGLSDAARKYKLYLSSYPDRFLFFHISKTIYYLLTYCKTKTTYAKKNIKTQSHGYYSNVMKLWDTAKEHSREEIRRLSSIGNHPHPTALIAVFRPILVIFSPTTWNRRYFTKLMFWRLFWGA